MHRKRFSSEKEVIGSLNPGQKVVVVQSSKPGFIEIYGNPTHVQHDVECLVAGAKAKEKQLPRILERVN